jgi:hypothetical protein
MHVDKAKTSTHEGVPLDEKQHLVVRRDTGTRQVFQQCQDLVTLAQVSAGQFTNNERLHQYVARRE